MELWPEPARSRATAIFGTLENAESAVGTFIRDHEWGFMIIEPEPPRTWQYSLPRQDYDVVGRLVQYYRENSAEPAVARYEFRRPGVWSFEVCVSGTDDRPDRRYWFSRLDGDMTRVREWLQNDHCFRDFLPRPDAAKP
ncbi:MAG: hypothetical protein JNM29_12055 [Candidatus Odyssella sp.]|nr:hypothetical protein [Candidatus Odyssella sp.]